MKQIKVWVTKNEQRNFDGKGRRILGFACIEFGNEVQIHTIPFVNIGKDELEIGIILPLHITPDEEFTPALSFSNQDFEKRVCRAIKHAYTQNLKDDFDTNADYPDLVN
jgi:hypothetical protein